MTSLRVIATQFLLLSLAVSAYCESHTIIAPNGAKRIEYEFVDDSESHTNNMLRAKLIRGNKGQWSFSAKGRTIVFSWSPDSRYIVYGVVLAGRDMALYWLDTDAAEPHEHNLRLERIEHRVEATVPERRSGGSASRSQIDFDKLQWLSSSHCTLNYFYRFDRKAGDAILDLELASRSPELKIVSITSLPE